MLFSLTRVSGNSKTGPIATSMTSADTCPSSCGFKEKGCYAKYGPTAMHWKKTSKSLSEFIDAIECLPRGSMLRHNVAGDLPGENETVDAKALRAIAQAIENRKLTAWTYTHKHSTGRTLNIIRSNAGGLVVNLSADDMGKADALSGHGLPVVTVLPVEYETKKSTKTPEGRLVVVCPAAIIGRDTTCQTCGDGVPLCARPNRDYIIGFPAHGSAKKSVSIIATVSV